MEIIVSKEVAERIKTTKDLNDYYAFMERNYEYVGDPNELPTYSFPISEQDRIDKLTDSINYTAGVYDIENIKRIIK